jgi:hypothetical protein
MMNIKIIFVFPIVFAILMSGCVTSNKISDDEVYLESLEEFLSQNNQIYYSYYQQAGHSAPPEQVQKYEADMKILSTTFYNRVAPLKVSSKFEFSKNSFLQALKERETVADFLVSHPEDPLLVMGSLTEEEKTQYFEANKHNENYSKFFPNTFDGNVCFAARVNYLNITFMCKQLHP